MKLFFLDNLIIGVATDIGPRILYLADIEGPDFNLFGVLPEAGTQTQEGFWRIYGGHRFWSSPEAKPRSYWTDNELVRIVAGEDSVVIHGNAEPENSLERKIAIKSSSQNSVEIAQTIKNKGQWPIMLGCWALSVMKKHGFAVIPMKPSKLGEEGLLPDRRVTFWPYIDLSDSRLRFTKGYIFLGQDPTAETPCKVGAMANSDFGCNVEVYTNSEMLELETVDPLRTVNPSEAIQHRETWKVGNLANLSPEPESVKKRLEGLFRS